MSLTSSTKVFDITPRSSDSSDPAILQTCVDETPHEDRDRSWRLEELGFTHWYKFKETNKDNHLSLAIQRVQEAVQMHSDYYPDRTRQLRIFGSLLRERYQRSQDATDQQLAIQCFNEGLREGRAAPIERWRAGRALVRLHGEAGNWSLAYEAAHAYVDQIPRVLSRGLQVSDKQSLVTAPDDFSLEAAAVAMMAEQPPYEAIRLIELGRGLTLGSLGEMRTDISQLQDEFPELGSDIQTGEAILGDQLGRESLRRLWDTIANPVLTCPGLTRNIEENWPRLWWITGALAKFPIHAAGEYYEDWKNSVFDRVISSYSLSVQMLLRGRQYRQNRWHQGS
ncbi:unnamed protein product [Clonostachys chloroleuca]|uniref:Uncharacterized protein n=1 Tax=Clonostachys chloroleuca TaxID=1926264 RepID=A0AA35MC99_9HYPO|nr:unnamed protein product [Clonostachys chloroleuca]